jgi:hypothetical protein
MESNVPHMVSHLQATRQRGGYWDGVFIGAKLIPMGLFRQRSESSRWSRHCMFIPSYLTRALFKRFSKH